MANSLSLPLPRVAEESKCGGLDIDGDEDDDNDDDDDGDDVWSTII